MCNLIGHVVKRIASVSVRRRRNTVPASGPHPSRETTGSSAIATPESPLSNRGTSHVQNDDATARYQSSSGIPTEAQESRISAERRPQKRSTTSLTKVQGPTYGKEGEGTETKLEDEHKEVDAHPPLAHDENVQPVDPSSESLQHLFEAQSRELSILQREWRAAIKEKKALTDAYAALRQQYDERCKKLSAMRHERQAVVERRKEIDDAYATLKQQYDEEVKKLNAVRHERLAALEQKQKVEEECSALKEKYEAQQGEYGVLNNKYQSLKAVLEQRTSELQGVQKFSTMEDASSGLEIVNSLRNLNEEVHQITTLMAEWAVENFMFDAPATDQTDTQNIEQTRTLETLGIRFMQLLGTKKHKDNPILMDMAFRAYLIYELYWVASPWSIGQEEQAHNLYVDAIYQRIRETEGQAVSGNWRALTRAYTLPACVSDPEVAHTFNATIVSGFSDILVAAGCTMTKSDITSALWSNFGDKIHHFVSLAGQVNKIIGVGVISEDFEVLVIWPDVVFDERVMADAYDNGDRVKEAEEREQIVLCATELGLMQRMSVGTSSGQKGKSSELIVIKPGVTLTSVVNIIE